LSFARRILVYFVLIVIVSGGTFAVTLYSVPSYPVEESTYFNAIGVPALQRLGLDGSGVRVAVIDSGIDSNLSIFKAGQVIAWKDFVGKGTSPYDDNRHGTAVASIIAGRQTSLRDVDGSTLSDFTGVSPGVSLIVAKVSNSTDQIKDCQVVSDAIHWAMDYHPDIINLSIWCGYTPNGQSVVDQAVDWAYSQGALVVTIAGNNGGMSGTITAPGDAADALTVGATNVYGTSIQPYSGVGPTADGRIKPDLVAPSGTDPATYPGMTAVSNNGILYYDWEGTSFAAPLVVGIAALLKQWNPDLTAANLTSILEDSAHHLGPSGQNDVYGYGLVDASAAFTKIVGASPESIVLTRSLRNAVYGLMAGALLVTAMELVVRRRHPRRRRGR
jgi:serine protease AprX